MLGGICIFEFHGYGSPGMSSRILYLMPSPRPRPRFVAEPKSSILHSG